VIFVLDTSFICGTLLLNSQGIAGPGLTGTRRNIT